MSALASLGMYDFPWLAPANDALWAALATRLREAGVADVPARLERERTLPEIWHDPGLLLGHTCGFPLVTALAGQVRVVATPCHDLPGCAGAWHRSFIVVRADDHVENLATLRGRRCAINARDSNTGMNLFRATIAPLARGEGFFAAVRETGAHLESLRAVRDGEADVAAIDCVTQGLVARDRPGLLRGTRVLAWTPATPALPLITARSTSDATLAALRAAVADAALRPLWSAIGVRTVVAAEARAYAPVTALIHAATQAGYPRLA